MIPAQTVNGLAWASRCGHPACHATFRSRPGDTRREAEKRATNRGWRFTATPASTPTEKGDGREP